MDEINVKLINLIKSSPCIYDKTNIYYSNKDYIKVIWFKISNQMQLPVPVCQKRWRYLRDYFVRQLRIYQHENTKSSWPFFQPMSFIIPFSTTRKRSISNNNRTPKNNKISKLNINQAVQNESKLCIRENSFTKKEELNIFECLNFYQKNYNETSNENFSQYNSSPEVNDQTALGLLKSFVPADLENYRNITVKTESIDSDSLSVQEQYYPNNIKENKFNEKFDNNQNNVSNSSNELKSNFKNNNEDEHSYFFKSLLSNIRNIDNKYILQFRTEILQLISKYQLLTDHEKNSKKLLENYNLQKIKEELNNSVGNSRRDSSFSDVVIIETDNFNWREKLNKS